MRFTPKSENEIQMMNLMDAGTYSFFVISSKDEISKNNNEQIKLKLKVWDVNGSEHIIYDYLLEAMAYKLRHFCEITDLIDKYNNGAINAIDCEHKTGKVEIIIQAGQNRPDGGKYADKNSVKDYVKSIGKIETAKTQEEFFNDDVPF